MTYHHQLTEIRSFLNGESISVPTVRKKVIQDEGLLVRSYEDLVTKIAELTFYNPHDVFLFRGHAARSTTQDVVADLTPSLFQSVKERLPKNRLIQRMLTLKEAEIKFFDLYKEAGFPNYQELGRSKLKRWALLEHLGICRTPLLEVSASLRVAATVASAARDLGASVYVLGIPSLAGAMTIDQSGDLHVVRLASVCPLTLDNYHALDSYMLGQYTNISDFETDQFALEFQSNFADRLLAKFRFQPKEFWANSAPENHPIILDMGSRQSIYAIADQVKSSLSRLDSD